MSRKENTKQNGDSSALKGAMFSFPTIFALMGTSTVILFERVWTSSLNITLPYGTNISSASSSLIPHFLTYLALMSLVLIGILLVMVTVGLIGLALVSFGRAVWALRYRFKLGWRIVYGWFLTDPPLSKEGEPTTPKEEAATLRIKQNKVVIQATEDRIAAERAAIMDFVNTARGRLTDGFAGGWAILFGGDKISLATVSARAGILACAVLGLLLLTSALASGHIQQLAGERTADGYLVKSDDPHSNGTDNADGDEISIGETAAAAVTVPLECTTLRSGLHNTSALLTFLKPLSTEITCGRVTLASGYPLQGSRLRDRDGATATRVSAPVFHLGNYGDWVVLAPFDAPTERVFVQARQVLEFSQSGPQPDDPPSVLATMMTRVRTAVNRVGANDETVRWAQLLILSRISEKISTSTGPPRTTDPNINTLVSEAVETALQDRPWIDEVTRATVAQTNAIAALEQRFQDHLAIPPKGTIDELNALLRGDLATLNSLFDRDISNVSVELPPDFATQVSDALRRNGTEDDTTPAQNRLTHSLEAQVSRRFNKDDLERCVKSQVPVPPIIFAEGRADVSRTDVDNIITTLTEGFKWNPDGTQGLFRVQLIGFASATGMSPRNSELAERRADNVKQALVEALFGDTPGFDGNAEGPTWLTKSGLIVLAYGGGELLDGADNDDPRRVEIHVCQLNAPAATGDLAIDLGADGVAPVLTTFQD